MIVTIVTIVTIISPFLYLPYEGLTDRDTQTNNDWYDGDIDAINEPNRPIPSGAISEPE